MTTQTVDQLNRLSTFMDAENGLSSINKYDSHSRPLTVTDPRGNKTTYVYDGFGDTLRSTCLSNFAPVRLGWPAWVAV